LSPRTRVFGSLCDPGELAAPFIVHLVRHPSSCPVFFGVRLGNHPCFLAFSCFDGHPAKEFFNRTIALLLRPLFGTFVGCRDPLNLRACSPRGSFFLPCSVPAKTLPFRSVPPPFFTPSSPGEPPSSSRGSSRVAVFVLVLSTWPLLSPPSVFLRQTNQLRRGPWDPFFPKLFFFSCVWFSFFFFFPVIPWSQPRVFALFSSISIPGVQPMLLPGPAFSSFRCQFLTGFPPGF